MSGKYQILLNYPYVKNIWFQRTICYFVPTSCSSVTWSWQKVKKKKIKRVFSPFTHELKLFVLCITREPRVCHVCTIHVLAFKLISYTCKFLFQYLFIHSPLSFFSKHKRNLDWLGGTSNHFGRRREFLF